MSESVSPRFIRRLLDHVRNGTLGERLGLELWRWKRKARRWNARRLRKKWKRLTNRREYLDHPVGEKTVIRLYRDSILSESIFCGQFETAERQFVRMFLKPNDVFVDVGANVGLYTVLAAEAVGPFGSVIAIEPTSTCYMRLLENIKRNTFVNIHAIKVALWDREGYAPLNISMDGHDAWNSFGTPQRGGTFSQEEVKQTRLDTLAAERPEIFRAALIKIDVEGSEYRVIDGARNVLGEPNAPTLLLEFNSEAAAGNDSSCRQVAQILADLGYQLFRYDQRHNSLERGTYGVQGASENLVASKNSREILNRIRNVHNS